MLRMGVLGIISAMHAAVTLLPLLGVREVGRRASSAAGGRTQTRKGKGPVDGLTWIVSAASQVFESQDSGVFGDSDIRHGISTWQS